MTTINTVLNPAEFSADEAAAVADAVARVHSNTEYKLDMQELAQKVFDAAQVSPEPDIADRKQLAVLGAAVPATRQAALDAAAAFAEAHTEVARLSRAYPRTLDGIDGAGALAMWKASPKAQAAKESLAAAVVAQIRAAEAYHVATSDVGMHRAEVLKARQAACLELFNGLAAKHNCLSVASEGSRVSYNVVRHELVVDFKPRCEISEQSGNAMFASHTHADHQRRIPCELASQVAAK